MVSAVAPELPEVGVFQDRAAFSIARMPALMASGRAGQASTTAASSGSHVTSG
jgi:hypothetical protein